MPKKGNFKISYIKKPLARKSLVAIFLCVAAAALGYAGLHLSVTSGGSAGLNAGACGFCSILVSMFAIGYAGFSFGEKEKNYILAKISAVVSAVLLIFWIALIIIAL